MSIYKQRWVEIAQLLFLSCSLIKHSWSLYGHCLYHRVREFERVLQNPVINLKELRSLCFNGIPDDTYSFRSLCWKLLLGYLPENQAKWKSTLQGKRDCYQQLLGEIFCPLILIVADFHTFFVPLKNQTK